MRIAGQENKDLFGMKEANSSIQLQCTSGIGKSCFAGLNATVCVMPAKRGLFTFPANTTRQAGVLGTARNRECDGLCLVLGKVHPLGPQGAEKLTVLLSGVCCSALGRMDTFSWVTI